MALGTAAQRRRDILLLRPSALPRPVQAQRLSLPIRRLRWKAEPWRRAAPGCSRTHGACPRGPIPAGPRGSQHGPRHAYPNAFSPAAADSFRAIVQLAGPKSRHP
jgi:hypothetical protein